MSEKDIVFKKLDEFQKLIDHYIPDLGIILDDREALKKLKEDLEKLSQRFQSYFGNISGFSEELASLKSAHVKDNHAIASKFRELEKAILVLEEDFDKCNEAHKAIESNASSLSGKFSGLQERISVCEKSGSDALSSVEKALVSLSSKHEQLKSEIHSLVDYRLSSVEEKSRKMVEEAKSVSAQLEVKKFREHLASFEKDRDFAVSRVSVMEKNLELIVRKLDRLDNQIRAVNLSLLKE